MKQKTNFFERLAHKAIIFSGSTLAFIIALFSVFIWIIAGPYLNFSNTWLLLVNTGTTIITFLMMFLIQRMQNKDSRAIHLKLNELIAAQEGPSNRLINAEDLSEQELITLSIYYKKLAEMAKKEKNIFVAHSVEEAIEVHKAKHRFREK